MHRLNNLSKAIRRHAIWPMTAISIMASPPLRADEVVTVAQATNMSLTFAPILAAEELGFFKQEGIKLELLEFQGAAVIIPQLINKSITLAYLNADPLIISGQQGRDRFPLKFFFNAARTSIWEFIVRDDSPVKRLGDLRGKTLGVGGLANANVPLTRAMFKELGLASSKDYSLVAIGVGAQAFHAVLTGEVDAYNTFDVNASNFEATGAKIRRLPVEQKYQDLFSNGFVTHQDFITQKPAMLAGFGRAFAKGVLICHDAPAYCVKTFWKRYPNAKPATGSDEEKLQYGLLSLRSRMDRYLSFPPGQPHRFGEFDPEAWQTYADVLYAGGEVKDRNVDVSTMYSNELVPAMNDFDVAAVRSLAKGLQ
jgi:NitT/TauT family transport system substrate-binding protein